MELSSLLNIIILVAVGVFGWLLRNLFTSISDRVKKLEDDNKELIRIKTILEQNSLEHKIDKLIEALNDKD